MSKLTVIDGVVHEVEVVPMNVAQMWALFRRWKYYEAEECSFMAFMKRAQETCLMDGAIVVLSHGTWLAIETNTQGECHS